MKTRSGFVSNSSSSSFIIGYGKVKNKQLLQEYMNENKLKFDYDFTMFSETEHCPLSKRYDRNYKEFGEADQLIGGNDTSLTVPEEFRNEDIVLVAITNDEGDGDFSIYGQNGEWFDLDYSPARSKDYYDDEQLAVIELFEQPFIEKGEVIFGAERND